MILLANGTLFSCEEIWNLLFCSNIKTNLMHCGIWRIKREEQRTLSYKHKPFSGDATGLPRQEYSYVYGTLVVDVA